MGRFYAGIAYKYHSKWRWGKMFGLMELFHLIKVPREQSVAFPGPLPLSGPPPNNSDRDYFGPKEGPRAVGPTQSTEHTAEMWSPSVYSSHIWNPLLSAFIQEEKEHELSFLKWGSKKKALWPCLSDLAYPWTVKRLRWPEMHIPAPAPIPACQSELTEAAQWCAKTRNKNLERGHGGTWALWGGLRPSPDKPEPPESGDKSWLQASQGPSTAMCSHTRKRHCRSTHAFVTIGKKCFG